MVTYNFYFGLYCLALVVGWLLVVGFNWIRLCFIWLWWAVIGVMVWGLYIVLILRVDWVVCWLFKLRCIVFFGVVILRCFVVWLFRITCGGCWLCACSYSLGCFMVVSGLFILLFCFVGLLLEVCLLGLLWSFELIACFCWLELHTGLLIVGLRLGVCLFIWECFELCLRITFILWWLLFSWLWFDLKLF